MDWFNLDYLEGETWNDRTRRLGEGLGYPKCCIEAFLEEDYMTRPVRKLHGTGYIPCAQCNEKTHDELKAAINANRKCEEKFPDDPWPCPLVVISSDDLPSTLT